MRDRETKRDVEVARDKIMEVCAFYGVSLEWEDYSGCWLRDRHNGETAGFERR
jgi:hypothetical protein